MSEQVEVQDSGGGINFRLILGGLALAALLLFIFQNTDDAKVSFLAWDGTFPLYLLLLITVALTLVVAMMTTWFLRRRR